MDPFHEIQDLPVKKINVRAIDLMEGKGCIANAGV
jgi:hypothetical protein